MNMRRLAQCLAGDQVLVLSAHQPVLHQAGCLHRHIVLQPAAVPGLEVTVMTQQNQRLYLGGGGSRGMGSAPSLWRPTHPPNFLGSSPIRHLLGPAECAPTVHVVLRVDDEHHLVGAELEATVHVARTLHAHQPLPGATGLTSERPHLSALPTPEFLQVPREGTRVCG